MRNLKIEGKPVCFMGAYEVRAVAPYHYVARWMTAGGATIATASSLKAAMDACYKHKANVMRFSARKEAAL